MIQRMGRRACPYCSQAIPSASTIKHPRPSKATRTFILAEHICYLIVLALLFPRYRDLWAVNYQILVLRQNFKHPLPSMVRRHDIFRQTMIQLFVRQAHLLLHIIPLLIAVVCRIIMREPLHWRNGIDLIAAALVLGL
jgi:hypothetical protein